jgi:membrane protein implicated in regulation of membrane protease activity
VFFVCFVVKSHTPMSILWWHWLVLGLLLAIAELAASGGFYVLFFGVGALLVGLLTAAGLAGPIWMQFLLFTVLSILSLVVFRRRLLKKVQREPQRPEVDTLIGEVGAAISTIVPGEIGQVELRGALWSAKNDALMPLPSGARCRVLSVEGLMLHVEPERA